MGLGGVLLAGAGIIVAVLVANGRWPNVWNAALGQNAPSAASRARTVLSGEPNVTDDSATA